MLVLGLIPLLLAGISCEKVRFDDYRVYSLLPSTYEKLQSVITFVEEYDVWKYSSNLNDYIDVMVPPNKKSEFEDFLLETGISHVAKILDVQKLIDEEEIGLKNRAATVDWENYHDIDEIYAWLDDVCKNYSNVNCIIGGKSYEGRQIRGIEINFGKDLPGVFIESGIHAREWIAPASTTWMINQILRSPTNSNLRKFNYVYFPLFNPDGYVYSWTKDRLWRKTRTPYTIEGKTTYGADPNRNWDFHWNGTGASKDPSSESYSGPRPFSEVETKTLSEYIKSIVKPKKLDIYLTFHSYGQLLLYPWGHTKDAAQHKEIWEKFGANAIKAYKNVHDQVLNVGQTSNILYFTTGSSRDWFYGNFNSTVAFTLEMRDRGKYNFILPPDQIIPNSEEFFAVVKSILTDYLKLKNLY